MLPSFVAKSVARPAQPLYDWRGPPRLLLFSLCRLYCTIQGRSVPRTALLLALPAVCVCPPVNSHRKGDMVWPRMYTASSIVTPDPKQACFGGNSGWGDSWDPWLGVLVGWQLQHCCSGHSNQSLVFGRQLHGIPSTLTAPLCPLRPKEASRSRGTVFKEFGHPVDCGWHAMHTPVRPSAARGCRWQLGPAPCAGGCCRLCVSPDLCLHTAFLC